MDINTTFHIDDENSDEERLYVDIAGKTSVCIVVTDEGIIVDLFSAAVAYEIVATMGATWNEITESIEELTDEPSER